MGHFGRSLTRLSVLRIERAERKIATTYRIEPPKAENVSQGQFRFRVNLSQQFPRCNKTNESDHPIKFMRIS